LRSLSQHFTILFLQYIFKNGSPIFSTNTVNSIGTRENFSVLYRDPGKFFGVKILLQVAGVGRAGIAGVNAAPIILTIRIVPASTIPSA